MNRFLTKKKNKDAAETGGKSWGHADAPAVPALSSKATKKGKKGQQAPKPELDLSSALPSSDDFRTSLLMPNLSARFSMLREQDDPSSKIGKANDDSVLFPRRASRLNMFNAGVLADIAEIDSVKAIRPPFANERSDSYHSSDGYGTDDESSHNGSIMSRSRHREGNNLFGGRQKIYKIPVGGTASGSGNSAQGSGGGRMGGRFLYGDDVSTIAFRKLWEKEREEELRRDKESSTRREDQDTETDDRPASPPPAGYNRSRETSSSTASGPSNIRTSTAATSVASQNRGSLSGTCMSGNSTSSTPTSQQGPPNASGLDRSFTRSRRLYGQGLDQHMQEQQSSALYKLESLQQRAPVPVLPTPLSQSHSAVNLRDQYQRANSPYAHLGGRAMSPTTPTSSQNQHDLDFETSPFRADSRSGDRNERLLRSLSPTLKDEGESAILSSAVEPNDRGKATAMGAFNKPSQPYDETQYSKRQFQLHQARDQSPSTAAPSSQSSTTHSRTTDCVRSSSNRSHRTEQGEASSDGERTAGSRSQDDLQTDMLPSANETFFVQASESDDASERGSDAEDGTPAVLRSPAHQRGHNVEQDQFGLAEPVDDGIRHSANGVQGPRHSAKGAFTQFSPSNGRMHVRNVSVPRNLTEDVMGADSPTLGPTSGLSGLVRAHLRNDSGQSSIFPPPSPGFVSGQSFETPRPEAAAMPSIPPQHVTHESNEHDVLGPTVPTILREQTMAPPPLSLRAKQILDQAAALRDQHRARMDQHPASDKLGYREAPKASFEEPEMSWQEELRARHQRTESTETEKEREAFSAELMNRRKMVQESLRSYTEEEANGHSLVPRKQSPSHAPGKLANVLGPLHAKPGKGAHSGRQDPSIKAMKMLGISTGAPNSSSGSSPHANGPQSSQSIRQYQAREEPRNFSPRRGPSPPSAAFRQESPRPTGADGRSESRNGRSFRQGQSSNVVNQQDNSAASPLEEPRRRSPPTVEGRSPERSDAWKAQRGDILASPGNDSLNDRSPLPVQNDSPPSHRTGPKHVPITSYMSSHVPGPESKPPTMNPPHPFQNGGRIPASRKRSVNKSEISEPTFLSGTSSVNTMNLPAAVGSSGRGDGPNRGPPPPLPPINPRRRTAQQTIANAFGRGDRSDSQASSTMSVASDEVRVSSSRKEGDPKPHGRQKLRKSSSEGGNLGLRARQHALMSPPPTIPQSSQRAGGMF